MQYESLEAQSKTNRSKFGLAGQASEGFSVREPIKLSIFKDFCQKGFIQNDYDTFVPLANSEFREESQFTPDENKDKDEIDLKKDRLSAAFEIWQAQQRILTLQEQNQTLKKALAFCQDREVLHESLRDLIKSALQHQRLKGEQLVSSISKEGLKSASVKDRSRQLLDQVISITEAALENQQAQHNIL